MNAGLDSGASEPSAVRRSEPTDIVARSRRRKDRDDIDGHDIDGHVRVTQRSSTQPAH